MADESTQSVVMEATPERILSVIADFGSYPQWAQEITSAEVLESGADGMPAQVHLTVDAGPVRDEYTLAYDWAGDGLSVRWHLVKGQMQKAQNGSYVLRPIPGGTEVTYTLSVQLSVPMIRLLRRKAEKVIMSTALGELKQRVEQSGRDRGQREG
jgi:ribosome-associated toxin RatA of RatAB toxin-antitoxin module